MTTQNDKIQLIDIEKIIKNRKSKIMRNLPHFVIRYIKRIIHQDELNYLLKTYGHLEGIDFLHASIDYLRVKFKVVGIENIPKKGRYVFAANHPLGGADGLVLFSTVHKHFGEAKVIANDLIMNMKNFTPLFIAVNKHGLSSKESIRHFSETFASDKQILVFPAGLISRRIKGKITDLEWKKTFVTKALQYKRDIVPVHINGRVSNFFYNLAALRKFLNIKTNLEMFYLVDETYKNKDMEVTITFGKPISHQMLHKKISHIEWAQKIKQHVYKVAENPTVDFDYTN